MFKGPPPKLIRWINSTRRATFLPSPPKSVTSDRIMARDEMIVADLSEGGLFISTEFLALSATILERTARRHVERTGNIAGQNFNVLIALPLRREYCL